MSSRRRSIMLIAIMTIMAAPIARAEDLDRAKQLALQFTRFCLGRLTKTEISRRANRMGLTQTRVRTLEETIILSWRASKPPDDLLYSFDVRALPHQHVRIVGCSVGGQNVLITPVIAALEQPSILGKSNDDNAPSLIARNAGWFFVKNREPNWVSVMDIRFGGDRMVVVGVSTHQRLRP